jgi:hypothetical protein
MTLNSEIKMRSVNDGWYEYDSIAAIDQDVRMENMTGCEEVTWQLGGRDLT